MELAPQDKPSMKNIYESSYLDTVKKDEMKRGTYFHEKSLEPSSGIVGPNSSLFQQVADNEIDNVSLLSGKQIDKNQFRHNNMQPFIKGNVTQNTDVERFSAKLDMNTGVDKLYYNKKEVINENINTNSQNIYGADFRGDYFKERLTVSKVTNNILPFVQQYVGPGLNKGYTTSGSGGFHQNDTRDYVKPKNIDDLRSKTNQKNGTFEIPIQGPAKHTEQRSVITPLSKNKPETTYDQGIDNWFYSKASQTKSTARPELDVKDTHRQTTHTEYQGSAKLVNVSGMADNDDYGKSKIVIYDNERTCTKQTPISNLSTTVKALANPIIDAIRLSLKEYLIEAPRAVGNTSIQMPNKLSVHDTNDLMKTTVKETTIHDSEQLNLTGHDETYSALHDVAKTTVKETTIHDSENLNLTGKEKNYSAIQDDMKKTVRETVPMYDTVRNIGSGNYRVCVYNPEVAKTTVKETTVKGKAELGFIGGLINSILGGYATNEIDLRNSHKQFTVDNENIGIAKSTNDHRQMDRNNVENIEMDGARERLLMEAGGTPNPGRVNIPIDKKNIDMKTNKLIGDSYAARTSGNLGKIYQKPPQIDDCNITRDVQNSNAFVNRLDGSILKSLNKNDFNIKINPIKSI
jgi:hypothetical protein